jgi:hypothetical protein
MKKIIAFLDNYILQISSHIILMWDMMKHRMHFLGDIILSNVIRK